MNDDISSFTNTNDSSLISKAANGIKIWMLLYALLIFLIIISSSAFIYIFISDYQFLIYLNIPNVLMLFVTLFFALKYSISIKEFRLNNNPDSLAKAFKSQRNYFISLTSFIFIIAAFILVYLLYLFLYVKGMK